MRGVAVRVTWRGGPDHTTPGLHRLQPGATLGCSACGALTALSAVAPWASVSGASLKPPRKACGPGVLAACAQHVAGDGGDDDATVHAAVDGGAAVPGAARVRWISVVSHGTPVQPWASGSMKPSSASATSGERTTTTKRTRA